MHSMPDPDTNKSPRPQPFISNPVEVELSREQEMLFDAANKFINSKWPLSAIRELAVDETGLPRSYLAAAADLGWFGMLVPEEYGGGNVSGEGLRDLAIVAESRGRGLQPGPFIPMNVVAAALVARGSPELKATVLRSIASGEAVATWVVTDGSGSLNRRGITATADDGGFWLSGHCGLVQDGTLADWFLVTAAEAASLRQFLLAADTAGITTTLLESHDITQRFAEVSFDQVWAPSASVVGEPGAAVADLEHQLEIALVLIAAETLGAIDALFEMTRRYSLDRIAFGRPIGSFQAVKHQLADMSLSLEAGKSIVALAARAVQVGQAEAGEIASMAKAWLGDTGIDIAQGCFQVFGGIGYAWEHDSHLFLRRITMNTLLFGQPDWHRERICEIHGV